MAFAKSNDYFTRLFEDNSRLLWRDNGLNFMVGTSGFYSRVARSDAFNLNAQRVLLPYH